MASSINVRSKGQTGEREVSKMLNDVVSEVNKERNNVVIKDSLASQPFQRNQNQSAVGGHDLSNPLGLAIEVKRQETLSIEAWWKQCLKSAERFGGLPILIYRQNRKPWRVIMPANITTGLISGNIDAKVEIDIDTFLVWFRAYYIGYLSYGLTDWRTIRERKTA
jgi:Holliday junction resolvase